MKNYVLAISNTMRESIIMVFIIIALFVFIYTLIFSYFKKKIIKKVCKHSLSDNSLEEIELTKKLRIIDDTIEVASLIVPFVIIYIIFTKVISISVVQTGSMEPTLKVGNTVFYNQYGYAKKDPERGDVVMFWSEEYGEYFAKRIIALPGEEIRFIEGKVVIDNHVLDEKNYLAANIKTYEPNRVTFTVPDGCYFMLGDDREFSNDSRYWENPYIPFKDIIGIYMGQIDFSVQFDVLNDIPLKTIRINHFITEEERDNSYLEYIISDMEIKGFF